MAAEREFQQSPLRMPEAQSADPAKTCQSDPAPHRTPEADERLRLALEATDLAVWEFDPATGLFRPIGTAAALWGLKPGDSLDYADWLERLHPDDRPQAERTMRRALDPAGSGQLALQYRVVQPDGSVRWVAARSQTQFAQIDGQRRAVRIVGTVLDITGQKQADQALVHSEALFRATFEGSAIGMAWVNLDGRIVKSNGTLQAMLGYSGEELAGKRVSELTHPEDRCVDGNPYQEMLDGKRQGYQIEKRYVRKDGRVFWARLTVSAVRDAAGRVQFCVGALLDISEQKKAQEDSRRNEERLESLLRISQQRAGSIQDLLDFALQEALVLTRSQIGYIYRYDEAKREFTLNSWSREVMQQCRVAEKQTVYQLDKTGLWGEAVRQARPVIVNDFAADHPLRKGYPEGHAPLQKFMTVPVFVDDHIVGVVGVANKQTDYDSLDVRQLTLLMYAAWKIVDRQRAEQALQASEERERRRAAELEAVLQTVPVPVWIAHDPRCLRITSNRAAGEVYQVSPHVNISPSAPEDMAVPRFRHVQDGRELRPEDLPMQYAATHNTDVRDVELDVVRPDGSRRTLWGNASPLCDERGEVCGAVGAFMDVTARRQAEQRVREAEARFRRLVDGNILGVIVSNRQAVLEANDVFLQMVGYSRQDLEAGRIRWPEMTTPQYAAADRLGLEQLLATGSCRPYEKEYIRKDGRRLPILIGASLLTRDPLTWICFVLDLTERKQSDEAIRRHNAVLEGINKILGKALTCQSEEELGIVCLEVAEQITQSRFGFIAQINEQGLQNIAISNPGWDACNRIGPHGHRRPPEGLKIHGIYGRVLTDGQSLFTNDLASHPDRIGLPPGHPPVDSFLGVPLQHEGKTIGMVAVGNRPGGYTQDQQQALEALAPAIVEAFQRKRAEEALRRSEQRFRHLVGVSSQIVWTANARGEPVDDSPSWRAYTGRSLQQWLGSNWLDVIHPDDRQRVAEAWGQAVAAASPHQIEFRQLHHSGQYRHIACQAAPVRNADGSVREWVGMSTDITERKLAEEALEEALQRLRFHVENSPLAVIEFDEQLRISRWTGEAERVFGWTAAEVLGKGMYEIPWIHREDMERVRQVSGQMLQGTARTVSPNRNYRKDGSVIYCQWYNSTLLDAEGKMSSILSLVLDVTDRVLAQERLRELNESLERRVAERTAVAEERASQLQVLASQMTQAEERERRRVAHILHEHFQQLLVGAKFDVKLMQTQLCGRPDCKGPPILDRINQVLDQSIAESRSLTVELSPPVLYAAGLAEALQWLGRWMHDKHGLAVEVQADKAAEPASEDLRILLFQGVRELLFNIVKHAAVQQARVQMDRGEQGHTRIRVTDQGAGFSPKALRKEGQSGGFGIFSLRERLEYQGGQLVVDSRPGRGTTVVLTVPDVLRETGTQLAVLRKDKPGFASAVMPQAGKIRILVADDHLVVRDGLARLLALQPDIDVVGQAADGQQAVEMALQLRPNVVLMDVSMPRLSGIEATRCIVSQAPQVRVVGLSMHSDEGVAAAMAEAGAAGYVRKTAPAESLLAAVRAAMGSQVE